MSTLPSAQSTPLAKLADVGRSALTTRPFVEFIPARNETARGVLTRGRFAMIVGFIYPLPAGDLGADSLYTRFLSRRRLSIPESMGATAHGSGQVLSFTYVKSHPLCHLPPSSLLAINANNPVPCVDTCRSQGCQEYVDSRAIFCKKRMSPPFNIPLLSVND